MRLVLALWALSSSAFAAVCPTADATSQATGPIASGTTVGRSNDYFPSCVTTNTAGDYQVEYTAALAGTYTFDTVGSTFDTVLSAISVSDCATTRICNDDTPGIQPRSRVELVMNAGEKVLLSVDGYSGAAGSFVLNATWAPPPVCAFDADLGSVLGQAVATGTTCGASASFGNASCAGGQGAPDVAYAWRAPSNGTFTFDLSGSPFDTGMTLRGITGVCGEIACDDSSGAVDTSRITRTMTAGEGVLVVVDGYGANACGLYTLAITCLDANADGICDGAGGCPDGDGDGVCDANDLCDGDDATGDSDSDGVCDDLDFAMVVTALRPGQAFTASVINAVPNSTVVFLVSTRGPGVGPCGPNGVCADLLAPLVLGQLRADAQGRARLSGTVPANVPAGTRAWFQAAYVTAASGDVTEVDRMTVQ